MADCDSIPTRLSLQLDRQLSPAENSKLATDLQNCPQYVVLAQTMAQIDFMFRSAPALAPSRDLTRGVLARIEHRRDQRVLGLTFLVGALVSLGPTLLLALAAALSFITIAQPGRAENFVSGLTYWLAQLYAVIITLGSIGDKLLSPWLLPAAAATFSMFLLGVTVIWARKVSPAIRLH